MKIYRASNFLDAYRAWAKSDDINDLSGRTANAPATRRINERIAEKIALHVGDSLVDVGCGDGTLVLIALGRGLPAPSVVGILPTPEEVERVGKHIAAQFPGNGIITEGFSDRTGVPDGFASKCVCNSVLHMLPGMDEIAATLTELARITRRGGTVFVGELPETAMATVVKSVAPQSFWQRLKGALQHRIIDRFDRRVQVVVAPSAIQIAPAEFEQMAALAGLELVERVRSITVTAAGEQQDNPYRWDYVLERV